MTLFSRVWTTLRSIVGRRPVVSPVHENTYRRPDIARDPLNGSSWMLKITGCKDSSMWYRDKVGQYVGYCGTWPEGYKSREDAGYLNIVKFEDASLVLVRRIPKKDENEKPR